LPVVTIAAADANAAETPLDSGAFRVSRTGSTAAAMTVFFNVGGSATSGSDYAALGTSVIIPAGSATADITVTPINDSEGEDPESVVATLSASGAYTVGSPSSATVTITSEDPLVRLAGTSPTAGPEGNVSCPAGGIPVASPCPVSCPTTFDGTVFQITVSRVGSTAASLDVTLGLGGAASAFTYYVRPQVSGGGNLRMLTIPAGDSQAKFCVITITDTTHDSEARKDVTVTIQPSAGYTVGTPSSTSVTIVEDDN
jgi:Calx-beta domain